MVIAASDNLGLNAKFKELEKPSVSIAKRDHLSFSVTLVLRWECQKRTSHLLRGTLVGGPGALGGQGALCGF